MKSTIRISNNGNTIRATGDAAKALFKALTESPEPKGLKFFSKTRNQEMVLCQDTTSEWNGWLLFKHPDGQWVSLRKATEKDFNELAQAASAAHHTT